MVTSFLELKYTNFCLVYSQNIADIISVSFMPILEEAYF